jgi:ribosomal protein S18 acetylase RimI-like enzyme
MSREISIRQIQAADVQPLGEFFSALAADWEAIRFFHPHPFTPEFAGELCGSLPARRDRYYVATFGRVIIAYMMLRGWDEGYSVPSFGVCNHPALRDVGLGQALLAHAVSECRNIGATKLRLTVFKNNERAVHVYRKFGFVFQEKSEQELVGILDLDACPQIPVRPINLAKINDWLEAQTRAA